MLNISIGETQEDITYTNNNLPKNKVLIPCFNGKKQDNYRVFWGGGRFILLDTKDNYIANMKVDCWSDYTFIPTEENVSIEIN